MRNRFKFFLIKIFCHLSVGVTFVSTTGADDVDVVDAVVVLVSTFETDVVVVDDVASFNVDASDLIRIGLNEPSAGATGVVVDVVSTVVVVGVAAVVVVAIVSFVDGVGGLAK